MTMEKAKLIDALGADVRAVFDKYAGQLTLAEAIGVMEVIKVEMVLDTRAAAAAEEKVP